jgi:hypothetical protein
MDEKQRITSALNEIMLKNKPRIVNELAKVKAAGNNVLSKVGKFDSRFNVESKEVGSLACGTSALTVNECDAVIPVQIEGILEKTPNLEYVKFRPTGRSAETWRDCLDSQHCMDPIKFSNTFFDLVESAFTETKKELNFTPTLRGRGTVAATIVYHFPGLYETSIDLVPIIVVDLEGGKSNDFLQDRTYQKLRDMDIELTAKNNESAGMGSRLSFSCFETDFIKKIAGSHHTFQKLLVIFKLIRRFYLAPKEERIFPEERSYTPILKSYHMKILLLHEYAEYPSPSPWTEEQLADRSLSILQRLIGYIQNQFLPHFILSSVNLFNYGIPGFLLTHDLVTNTVPFLEKMAKTNLLRL